MLLKRFYDEKLAQASYLIGCAATGEALIVDPNRHVDAYLQAAAREGLRISHVTETHIHADFVSGLRELAERHGVQAYLSGEGGEDWQYDFAGEIGATFLRDGDSFKVGNIRIDVLHTPGHTPEHLAFLVTDTAGADRPMGLFSGDFVFVGDVGRPDLLEKAAGASGTMEEGARQLFRSLQRFRSLPDFLQVWPGHGAGSACGKALGAVPQTTVGYEKLFNWALTTGSEGEFVEAVLAGQPDPPTYFAQMKRINRQGPPLLGELDEPEELGTGRLQELLREGALVIDTRPAAEFAEGHLPGTINIPYNRSFLTWAGWLIPYDRDLVLVVDGASGERAVQIVRDLALIGLDRVAGYAGSAAVQPQSAEGAAVGRVPQTSPAEVAEAHRSGSPPTIVDVRAADEREAGHIPGSLHIPLGHLPERIHEVPSNGPVVFQCRTGARSAIATSVALASGVSSASNLVGGIERWQREGFPVTTGAGKSANGPAGDRVSPASAAAGSAEASRSG